MYFIFGVNWQTCLTKMVNTVNMLNITCLSNGQSKPIDYGVKSTIHNKLLIEGHFKCVQLTFFYLFIYFPFQIRNWNLTPLYEFLPNVLLKSTSKYRTAEGVWARFETVHVQECSRVWVCVCWVSVCVLLAPGSPTQTKLPVRGWHHLPPSQPYTEDNWALLWGSCDLSAQLASPYFSTSEYLFFLASSSSFSFLPLTLSFFQSNCLYEVKQRKSGQSLTK